MIPTFYFVKVPSASMTEVLITPPAADMDLGWSLVDPSEFSDFKCCHWSVGHKAAERQDWHNTFLLLHKTTNRTKFINVSSQGNDEETSISSPTVPGCFGGL